LADPAPAAVALLHVCCCFRAERVARLTAHDPQAHRRMLQTAGAISAGEDVPMVSWDHLVGEHAREVGVIELMWAG
jgi:hypothetical protein